MAAIGSPRPDTPSSAFSVHPPLTLSCLTAVTWQYKIL